MLRSTVVTALLVSMVVLAPNGRTCRAQAKVCTPRILYDRSHGQVPLSTRSILAGDIAALGWPVVENFDLVDANLLANYDILWLTEMPGPWNGVSYFAIGDWIDAGGCVLLSADDDYTLTQFEFLFDAVPDATGITEYHTNGTSGFTTNLASNSITNGVSSVWAPSPEGTFVVTSPAFSLVGDGDGTPILVLSDEPFFGSIAWAGERFFTDDNILSGDNRMLGNNIFQWLADGVLYPPQDLVLSQDSITTAVDTGDSSQTTLSLQNPGGCELDSRVVIFAPPICDGTPLLYETFDDGDFNGWTDDGGSGSKSVTFLTAANGSAASYHESGSAFGHSDGISRSFGSSQPGYVGFWVRSANTTLTDGYFVVRDSNDNDAILFRANSTGAFACNTAEGGDGTFAYLPNRWYFVQFTNIDFGAKTFDYYLGTTLVKAGVSFRNAVTVTDFAKVELYNFSPGGEAWWDEIVICDTQPTPWLAAGADPGNVLPYSQVQLDIMLGGAQVPAGAYRGMARVESDAVSVPVVELPIELDVTTPPTGIGDGLPRLSLVGQNYPNPFNPSTVIPYEVRAPGSVELSVYDASGRLVRRLVDGRVSAGRHLATWDGTDGSGRPVASGVYFYRMRAGGLEAARKMVLLK